MFGGESRKSFLVFCFAAMILATAIEPASSQPFDYEQLRARADRQFERGALLLPNNELRDHPGFWMSPLIVVEMAPGADNAADFTRFGPLRIDEVGRTVVDPGGRLTVYIYTNERVITGRKYKQIIHLWFYPNSNTDLPPVFRGVRQILDERGFSVLWEAIPGPSNPHLSRSEGRARELREASAQTESRAKPVVREFYVAKSLEKAAAAQYGPPLPGRRFSIENSRKAYPRVAVVRIAGEGPQPMGPYVYVDARSQVLTTLRCRCESAQIIHYGPTLHYQLVSVEQRELQPLARLVQSIAEAELDGLFRWPKP